MFKSKKGIQLQNAAMAVLAIVLIAVLVIVALYLFTSLSTSMQAPGTSVSVVNESLTTVNEGGENLAAKNLRNAVCTVTACTNGTTPYRTVPADNYTATGCIVDYIGSTASGFNNTNWLCTYSYVWTADTTASNASDTTISNFSNYPALVGLVGTIVLLALVIGVLVSSFVFGGKNKA
jgi:amino acid transporter